MVRVWAAPGAPQPGGTILLSDRDGIRGAAASALASLQHGTAFTPATPSRLAAITKHLLRAPALRCGFDPAAPLGAVLAGLPASPAAVPGRACLWLRAPGTSRTATNRSRVIGFLRG